MNRACATRYGGDIPAFQETHNTISCASSPIDVYSHYTTGDVLVALRAEGRVVLIRAVGLIDLFRELSTTLTRGDFIACNWISGGIIFPFFVELRALHYPLALHS